MAPEHLLVWPTMGGEGKEGRRKEGVGSQFMVESRRRTHTFYGGDTSLLLDTTWFLEHHWKQLVNTAEVAQEIKTK